MQKNKLWLVVLMALFAVSARAQFANGNGDNANFSTVDNEIDSWWGLGIKTSCSWCIGYSGGSYGVVFDTRSGSMYAQGKIGIGTDNPVTNDPLTKLEVNGNVKLTSGSGASITFANGSVQNIAWDGTTCGGDYAESIDVVGDRKKYEPGDILVINEQEHGKFLLSSKPYSKLVAGIYSTKPGLTGRREGAPKTGEEVPMAMLGIVPTKVSAENGPIKPGNLLVSSSIPGRAMKGTNAKRLTGAVIGKAMAPLARE